MLVLYFGLWVPGPIIFHVVSFGSHYKSNGFPFSSQILLILVDLHPFYAHLSSFVLCTPILEVFMLQACFGYFCYSGCLWHPSDVTVVKR